eukprot:TRINITY_DN5607_c2_g1_i1.p1 TRINITY_DN5607_c2_g1~~TRINITY_DN5607_c2_g1_i1.p1  ORF type:complete len:107 (-),score=7.26 TRINITY_DN5607_c2_g1_i1:663-983(-)
MRQKNIELYSPLPIPSKPCHDLSLDFVLAFSMTLRKASSIVVIVDRYSKMVHFIPCNKTYDVVKVASLFLRIKIIVKLHDVPKTIVFDRAVMFMSYFTLIMEIDEN